MIEIRRYARARLYRPDAGQYVTVETLRAWQAAGTRFRVVDTETGDDITAVLLA